MIRVAVVGRGLVAARARTAIRTILPDVAQLTDDPAAARAVLLATSEEHAARFLESPAGEPKGRLIYDLTGYSKRSGSYTYALAAALFERPPESSEGVVAIPACYASSVLIPAWYLLQCGYVSNLSAIRAVSIGGRTTLGAVKKIAGGSLRAASEASTGLHVKECLENLPGGVEYCALTILVGDLRTGIITSGTLTHDGGSTPEGVAAYLDPKTLTLSRDQGASWITDGSFSNSQSSACCFYTRPNAASGGLDLISYVHNLDLPLSIIYAHMRAVLDQR